ncbi:hypothetical protein T10_594 [Trichinella papuae]|uniref:Uncharacterized protein n=1 Tax=Trichinella papuae TaxID=268474 RepID=A0A0V1MGQ9_9BILA|nr:hypothetical protein T10_594 [Trichinella papuae]
MIYGERMHQAMVNTKLIPYGIAYDQQPAMLGENRNTSCTPFSCNWLFPLMMAIQKSLQTDFTTTILKPPHHLNNRQSVSRCSATSECTASDDEKILSAIMQKFYRHCGINL